MICPHARAPDSRWYFLSFFAYTPDMFDPFAGMPRPNRTLIYLGACIIAGLRLAREKQVNVRVIATITTTALTWDCRKKRPAGVKPNRILIRIAGSSRCPGWAGCIIDTGSPLNPALLSALVIAEVRSRLQEHCAHFALGNRNGCS